MIHFYKYRVINGNDEKNSHEVRKDERQAVITKEEMTAFAKR